MIISKPLIHLVDLNLRGQTLRAEKWTFRKMISNVAIYPQFLSVGSVVGYEIEGVANGYRAVGRTAATSAVDILDHHRA